MSIFKKSKSEFDGHLDHTLICINLTPNDFIAKLFLLIISINDEMIACQSMTGCRGII